MTHTVWADLEQEHGRVVSDTEFMGSPTTRAGWSVEWAHQESMEQGRLGVMLFCGPTYSREGPREMRGTMSGDRAGAGQGQRVSSSWASWNRNRVEWVE